ncbi:MAG TPA: hypothetical protein VMR52_09065 [Dehalococcoidia bacterium]|nr:hypothetical protein [Dehalococcoidia bacterium]
MAAQNGTSSQNASADMMDMWRTWLNETERQLNSFFGEVLGQESFARVSANYVDAYSVIQRALNQSMERYLTTFNLPTHSDITELGERLSNIEERLASMENVIRTIAANAGVEVGGTVTQMRPRRTRKPRAQTKATE